MIDYFRQGLMEDAFIASSKKLLSTQARVFHFFYIITFYNMCHPIMYVVLILWESLQNAVISVMLSEAAFITYEIRFSASYIEKIIVLFLPAAFCGPFYS
jgi:hypothetical protein